MPKIKTGYMRWYCMKEFLFPYYQQLLFNLKSRQIDLTRKLYVQIDSYGYSVPIIELYQKQIGLNVMSPFEVASGCDVVEIGKQFPDLVMIGGIDKRVLAQDKMAIDNIWNIFYLHCESVAATYQPVIMEYRPR